MGEIYKGVGYVKDAGQWENGMGGGEMQRAYREGKGEGEKDNEEEVEGGRDEKETEWGNKKEKRKCSMPRATQQRKMGKESIKLHNQNVLICKDYPG